MKISVRCLALTAPLLLFASCATRSEFVPDDAPVTVGMPAALTDRERSYITEVDGALRAEGFQPVRHGKGELSLDFRIAEGPINTDTDIVLREDRIVLAEGHGRGTGVPMIGRDKVAERSFRKAFGEFQAALPGAAAAKLPGRAAAGNTDMEYVY